LGYAASWDLASNTRSLSPDNFVIQTARNVAMLESNAIELLLEKAYELFLSLASEHLPQEDIVDITLEFEDRGAVESTAADATWRDECGEQFVGNEWLEIWVGLLDHQDEFDTLYAKILMPLSGDSKLAKIRWKPEI